MKKFYIVTAKCGHVGKSKYILINFPVIAEDGREAAKIARQIPRDKSILIIMKDFYINKIIRFMLIKVDILNQPWKIITIQYQ